MTAEHRGAAIELCAGMGGIGIGLRELGFNVVRAFDSWDQAVAIYNHNAGGEVAEVCNLLSPAARAAVVAAARAAGGVDLLAAGPPCKGFTQILNGQRWRERGEPTDVRHHDGRNGQNRVLHSIPEYIALVRPKMFVIENVPDLKRHCDGRTFAKLIKRLRSPAARLTYRVEHAIYDAALFGTPQARRRLLIVGVLGARTKLRLPDPGPDLRPLFAAVRHDGEVPEALNKYLAALDDPDDMMLTTASQAFSDLPMLKAGSMDDSIAYASGPTTAFQKWVRAGAPDAPTDMRTPGVTKKAIDRLKHIPPGGCARSIPERHLNGLSRRFDSAYRRLHPDAPSTALSTKYDCVYHYKLARSLSVREYARLQGVPDRIAFPESLACRRSAYEMIGNSVPPRLAAGVLGAVLAGMREQSAR